MEPPVGERFSSILQHFLFVFVVHSLHSYHFDVICYHDVLLKLSDEETDKYLQQFFTDKLNVVDYFRTDWISTAASPPLHSSQTLIKSSAHQHDTQQTYEDGDRYQEEGHVQEPRLWVHPMKR